MVNRKIIMSNFSFYPTIFNHIQSLIILSFYRSSLFLPRSSQSFLLQIYCMWKMFKNFSYIFFKYIVHLPDMVFQINLIWKCLEKKCYFNLSNFSYPLFFQKLFAIEALKCSNFIKLRFTLISLKSDQNSLT